MTAAYDPPLNPDGDGPLWRQALVEAKCVVKRRIATKGTPVSAPAKPYLVVPILGQSNAQGMGFPLDPTGLDRPHPRVHQFAMCGPSAGTVILGVDPLLHDVPSKGVGFGVSFAKDLADETGRSVLLIPVARGDTSFAPKNGYTWDPLNLGTRVNLFRMALFAIDTVLQQNPGSQLATILWHQGETDVPLTTGPAYREKLDLVIDTLRERYGEDLPFILGRMVPEEMEQGHRDYPVIDAVHVDTPNRRPRTAVVAGPRSCINSETDRHYDAAGQRALGHGMWQAYRSLCGSELAAYTST